MEGVLVILTGDGHVRRNLQKKTRYVTRAKEDCRTAAGNTADSSIIFVILAMVFGKKWESSFIFLKSEWLSTPCQNEI